MRPLAPTTATAAPAAAQRAAAPVAQAGGVAQAVQAPVAQEAGGAAALGRGIQPSYAKTLIKPIDPKSRF